MKLLTKHTIVALFMKSVAKKQRVLIVRFGIKRLELWNKIKEVLNYTETAPDTLIHFHEIVLSERSRRICVCVLN